MAQGDDVRKRLEEIRSRLLGDPSREELEAMQMQITVLGQWDRMMMRAAEGHDHDHMDDHDHTKEPLAGRTLEEMLGRVAAQSRVP